MTIASAAYDGRGGMDMEKAKRRTAARLRGAVLLLLTGCLLPFALPHGGLAVPVHVEALLAETLATEQDPARSAFVRTACALTGQVNYFWGGKSHAPGWDPAWGWPRRVTSPGSDTTGRMRAYGLDCSGLVSWAAAAALKDPAVYEAVGEGVRAQYLLCVPTDTPLPGDLAFFPDLSHVGIVLGQDREGVLWVVHCSFSLGGVVVTPANFGFTQFGTPPIFLERSLRDFSIDK